MSEEENKPAEGGADETKNEAGAPPAPELSDEQKAKLEGEAQAKADFKAEVERLHAVAVKLKETDHSFAFQAEAALVQLLDHLAV